MTPALEDEAPDVFAEEMANAAIQGIGAVLSVIGLVVLIHLAIPYGSLPVASVAVYGGTLVLAFFSSALYHGVWHAGIKRILRAVDHCAIYFLIAGTYTPVALLALKDYWGWALLAAVWSVALTGAVLRIASPRPLKKLRIGLYVILGWLVVAWVGPVFDVLGPLGAGFLVAGGMAYTLGVAFYLWRRLPFNEAIWHVFVIAGSACFFVAIAFHAIPAYAR
ncbi:MAG: hemolysin III family protein [Rhodospirillales bacterium]|nr:hemolysin III family protein [Rhodospirillales bacterium]